jgi:hypothetical protein
VSALHGTGETPVLRLIEMVPPYFSLLSRLLGLCRVTVSA